MSLCDGMANTIPVFHRSALYNGLVGDRSALYKGLVGDRSALHKGLGGDRSALHKGLGGDRSALYKGLGGDRSALYKGLVGDPLDISLLQVGDAYMDFDIKEKLTAATASVTRGPLLRQLLAQHKSGMCSRASSPYRPQTQPACRKILQLTFLQLPHRCFLGSASLPRQSVCRCALRRSTSTSTA